MGNRIIIEGFWNTGKTTLLKLLGGKYGYKMIDEPDHLKISDEPKNINDWYVAKHAENLSQLYDFPGKPVALERSILSSMAFLYACGEKEDTDEIMKVFEPFKFWCVQNNVIILFLTAEEEEKDLLRAGVINLDIINKLNDSSFYKNYENFYKTILPQKYGISPIIINVFSEKHQRKSTADILEEIFRAYQN